MAFADYRPEEAVAFWRLMESQSAGRGSLPELLSDHPADARRIAQLQVWAPTAKAAKDAYTLGRIEPERR